MHIISRKGYAFLIPALCLRARLSSQETGERLLNRVTFLC